MARHVGRPTNEEVAARKRKQMLKILIPGGLVALAVVMIIGSTGLRGLMGASIGDCSYKCEEGWTPGENNVCYLESEDITKNLSSYVLGDTNNDGVMNAQDYDQINSDITNGVELDNIKQAIYDINQDGEVNTEDLTAFNDAISSTSTVGTVSSQILVCPTETITTEQDEEGNEITVTTNYELNNNQCIAKIRREKQAKKVCQGVDSTGGFFFSNTDNDSIDDPNTDNDSIDDSIDDQGDFAELDDKTKYKFDFVDVDVGAIDKNLKESDDESIIVDDAIQDLSYINNTSNYLNYGVDTSINESGVPIKYIGYFNFMNIDSVKNETYQTYDSILKWSYYYIYGTDDNGTSKTACDNAGYAFKIPDKTGYPLHSETISSSNGKIVTNVNTNLLIYRIHLPEITNAKKYWIKQIIKPSGYNQNTACTDITKYITKNKTDSKGVTRSNSPIKYTIKSDAKTIYDLSTKKYVQSINNARYSHVVKVKANSKKGYAFNGYTATRTYTNNEDKIITQYLCYTNQNKTEKAWVTNNPSCKNINNKKYYGNYIFGKNGSNIVGINGVSGATVSLKSSFSKINYTIKYNLNGGKNNASNPAKYNVTTNTTTLKNPTRSGYTFKGWYSDSKYKTRVTQIKKGSTGNKTLYAKWSKK